MSIVYPDVDALEGLIANPNARPPTGFNIVPAAPLLWNDPSLSMTQATAATNGYVSTADQHFAGTKQCLSGIGMGLPQQLIEEVSTSTTNRINTHLLSQKASLDYQDSRQWQSSCYAEWDPTFSLPLGVLDRRFLSTGTGNGWTTNYIYQYDGSIWLEHIPTLNDIVVVQDGLTTRRWNGTAWVTFGPVGSTGSTGPTGSIGPTGSNPQGPTGPTGSIGSAGPAGVTGSQGSIGFTGAMGPITSLHDDLTPMNVYQGETYGHLCEKLPTGNNTLFYASFYNRLDANIINYGVKVTPSYVHYASISSHHLDMSTSHYSRVTWYNTAYIDPGNIGSVSFTYIPTYDGYPIAGSRIFSFYNDNEVNVNNNLLLEHHPDGYWSVVANNVWGAAMGGVVGVNWSAVSGQTYQIRFDWNFTSGGCQIYIDGTLHGTNPYLTHGPREGTNRMSIGTSPVDLAWTHYYMNDFAITNGGAFVTVPQAIYGVKTLPDGLGIGPSGSILQDYQIQILNDIELHGAISKVITLTLVKFGQMRYIFFPDVIQAKTGTDNYIYTIAWSALPADFCPTTEQTAYCVIYDDSANSLGRVIIKTDGRLSIYKSLNGNFGANTNQGGFYSMAVNFL